MNDLNPSEEVVTTNAGGPDEPEEAKVSGAEATGEAAGLAEGQESAGDDAVQEEEASPESEAGQPSAAGESEAATAATEPAEDAEAGPAEEAPTDSEESAGEQPEPGVPGMDWYIIHTYSGFENKVKESLRTRAEAFGYGDRIGEVLIPTEDVVEMKGGKKVTSKRLLYRGYVLVQLDMDDELWHVVRNTPRVTGFVGGGQTPQPLSADEVNQILYRQQTSAEKPRPKMSFEHNDRVKIIDGPFTNFTGTVEEVNEERNTLKVMVTIFGRGTPVELEYFQVEKDKV